MPRGSGRGNSFRSQIFQGGRKVAIKALIVRDGNSLEKFSKKDVKINPCCRSEVSFLG